MSEIRQIMMALPDMCCAKFIIAEIWPTVFTELEVRLAADVSTTA
jgi:hypothetical protein